jgi:pyruvate dehydrogenase E2 component (dihydrolipoamide acetyltransferase)
MDIPASAAGIVKEVRVKPGDRVSEGSVIVILAPSAPDTLSTTPPKTARLAGEKTGVLAAPGLPSETRLSSPARPTGAPSPAQAARPADSDASSGHKAHASPSVRAYARELGADLRQITPSGPKGRILREDVTAFVKGVLISGAGASPSASGGTLDLLPWPKVDFARFGAIELRPLSRIQKISAQNLARNWVMIPAVTYHEDADISDLEAFRVLLNKENEKGGGAKKLTLLAFLIKASVKALQKFPTFNSSLEGDNLVLKQYFHIGFAADTPNGLVVPVIKNADQKSVYKLAEESGELAQQARDGKLKPADMQGASFTISSLGGIGGTAFSPIINAPEVAILGVNKSATQPVWDGKTFAPRLILPLSLTADHRVIDGALATRFNVYLAQLLADFRRVTL